MFKLNEVLIAFPSLFTPKAFDSSQTPKYQATFLIDKDSPQIAAIRGEIKAAAEAKWGKSIPKGLKAPLNDGDEKEYEGFGNRFYLNAYSPDRPMVVDRRRNPVVEFDSPIFPGCVVNAIVQFWAQDNQYGKRINCALKGVQFVRDGQRLTGAGPISANEFDSLENDDDSPF